MNDSIKTLIAFVGGAAVGATLGVLLAPDKGAQTRRKLTSFAKDLTDDLSDAAKEKYEEFVSWKDKVADAGEEKVKNAADSLKNSADHVASRVKNAQV